MLPLPRARLPIMNTLRNLAIQQKMLVISLLICGAVLCLATAILFVFQVWTFRSQFRSDTTTLATVIANNSTAAIAFQDAANATEIVQALAAAKGTVLAATLATPDKIGFAHYGRSEAADSIAAYPPDNHDRFVGGDLLVTRPVTLKGERVGTLYLRADYRHTFLQLLGVYGLVVLGVVLTSTLLAT